MAPKSRSLAFLMVLLVVALGGCTTGGTQAPTTTAAPQTTTAHLQHNYTSEAPISKTFTVPDGAAKYDITAKIGGEGATVCQSGQSARLVIRGPTNDTYADLTPAGGSVVVSTGSGDSGCAMKVEHAVAFAAGTWTVEFSGSGAFVGIVDLKPSS